MRIKISLIFLVVLLSKFSFAQIVWESPKHEVVSFLGRQAQKGNITLSDYIQPSSRKEISKLLAQLRYANLSVKENKELSFYQKEFSEFDTTANNPSLSILKKDNYERFRMLSVKQDEFLLRIDPILTLETTQSANQNLFKESHGLSFFGQMSNHFSFQASFRDITESGTGIDRLKNFTPETGVVKTQNINPNAKKLNYSDVRGYLTYSWKNGDISVGKDQNLWGYGENGRITLSDKAPSYPFIRFDYQPLKWLRFHYLHAWLQSGLIDSNATYPKGNDVYGSNREIYISKFLAIHSLNFIPKKGLLLSLGESMVYSDRFDAAYLIPVLFFKAYDQYQSRYNINTGSNGQFFFQASSRNHIKNTHLYGTLFIDEIRTSEIFNSAKSRNQLGFNIGGSVTDVFIPYLTLGAEYTRINPFVYNNIIPAQTYKNQNYTLGDWMGSNSDRLIAYIKYTPIPRLKTSLTFQEVRKGDEGTIEQQYLAEPQPPFLFNLQKIQTTFTFSTSYEWINNLYLSAQLRA
ncbi:MAG: capsule assembly Wzi family protein, partial [Bacteroidetes bacterium]|nr:capsule assembly Wzi family protein [Bacteroidota bacterium]MBU1759614.1 capsule assembly Wzi family protein [Bacteroidota bacterium]